MKITGLESPALRRSLEGSNARDDLPWHMAWRRALEQAQWEERVRHQPAARAEDLAPVPDSHASAPTAPARTMELDFAEPLQSVMTPSRSEAGSQMPSALKAAMPLTVTPPRHEGLLSPPGGEPLSRAMTSSQDATSTTPASRVFTSMPGEWAQWLPRTMHMNVQGQQVRASVRDDSLDEFKARQLYQRMRGQLQEWGLELVELIVNGHPAQPDAADPIQREEKHHGG